MTTDRPQLSIVRIVARTPLLRTGLEALVAQAGATIAANAPVTLRTADTAATDADVEVVLDGIPDRVAITIQRLPDDATWASTHRLLRVLMSDTTSSTAVGGRAV